MSSSDLARFAAEIAGDVDRLFVAGHRATRPRAARILQEFELPGFGVLIDLRKLLLASGGVTLQQAEAIERYVTSRDILRALEDHEAQGLLQQSGDAFFPTELGKAVLLRLTDAQVQAITDLWEDARQDLQSGVELTQRAIADADDILPADEYPAFTAQRAGYVPPYATPAFSFWSHLSTLRYLRADAHALAWAERGLHALEAPIVTSLWLKGPQALAALTQESELPAQETMRSLQRRSWICRVDDAWSLTESGREWRDDIERETSSRNAAPYATLTETERERLARILIKLPGSST